MKSSSFGLMMGSANTKIFNNTITGNKYGVFCMTIRVLRAR